MKPVILRFIGGYWDGKTLRSDSADREERFLAMGCFEMSHHGAIKGDCTGLSDAAVEFARRHGWEKPQEAGLCDSEHHYVVCERLENEQEMIITFRCEAALEPSRPTGVGNPR